VVAESEYRHQALADLISFREVFTSLFFVSVGMLLAPSIIIKNIIPIMILLAGIIVGKSAVVFLTAMLLRLPVRVCMLTAVALAQVGEFSLVLMFAAQGSGLIEESFENSLISAAILSMFLTPFLISLGPQLAAGVGKLRRLTRPLDVAPAEEAAEVTRSMRDHVIIGGYGFAGRELARALTIADIPFVIVDLNVENVRKASAESGRAFFGDVTSQEVLERLGIAYAREFVLLINDPGATERAARVARKLAPDLTIIARAFYLLDIEPLVAAGADDVIPAEREAAVEVVSRLLHRHQVDPQEILLRCCQIRDRTEDEDK
jgi:CPA2 family monovalent cation:H+ antiporter-2